jgi:glycosyltransferase involved in cell wall biosynthesis
MNILLLLPSLDPVDGGPPESMRTLSRAFARLGHRVEIATLDDPSAPFLSNLDCPVTALGPGRLGKYRHAPALKSWLRARGPEFDIVVVNGVYQYHSFAARSVLRQIGVPYVVFTHGALDPWFKRRYPLKHLKKWLYWPWADYLVLRDAARVLFTTDEERLLARQSFWLYSAREAVVGYGTARPPAATDQQVEGFYRLFPQLRGKRLLLFLSRIDRKKGCELLLEAFSRCASLDPNCVLVMAGPDSSGWRAELEQFAATLAITDRVVWTGMLHGDNKWGAYRASDAFVLTSHAENFGIVVVEALACGTPTLISNRVNIWREVERAGAGLVQPDTVAGSEAMLREWLTMPPERAAQIRKATIPLFDSDFEIDRVAANILKVLSACTRDGAPAAHSHVSPPDSTVR